MLHGWLTWLYISGQAKKTTTKTKKKSRSGNANANGQKRAMKMTNRKSAFFDFFYYGACVGVYCFFWTSSLRVFISWETILVAFEVQAPRLHPADRSLFLSYSDT